MIPSMLSPVRRTRQTKYCIEKDKSDRLCSRYAVSSCKKVVMLLRWIIKKCRMYLLMAELTYSFHQLASRNTERRVHPVLKIYLLSFLIFIGRLIALYRYPRRGEAMVFRAHQMRLNVGDIDPLDLVTRYVTCDSSIYLL